MSESPSPLTEREQIACLAHRIYEDEGRPEGRAEEHWARAEHVIRERRLGVNAPANAPATPADPH